MSEEMTKARCYQDAFQAITLQIEGEDDWIAVLSTVTCELHHHLDYFHWTGFYRVVKPALLKVGPYQGGHGCLSIPFDKGVCGAAATQKKTQCVEDVDSFPGHIACASSTRSEIVVPVFNVDEQLVAVLDVDSDLPAAFDATDIHWLEKIAERLREQAPILPWKEVTTSG